MTDVVPSRINLQQEEVDFRSPIGQNLLTRFAQSVAFVNTRQYDSHAFNLNGPINLFDLTTGADGAFVFLFDAEITGFSYQIGVTSGGSGTMIVDVHRITGGSTDAGTIFSTRPAISSAASDGSYTAYRELDSTTLANPTGHTLAVLSTTEVDAGDALRLDLDQAQAFKNFSLNIHYRPR